MLTDLRRPIMTLLLPLCLLVPSEARAQHATAEPVKLERELAAAGPVSASALEPQRLSRLAGELTDRVTAQPGQSRDSLKNGTLIGAAVGALALGGFGAILCNALQEPSDPSCLPDVLRIAAIGAAIGAGAGLAVDAAFTRHGGVAVRVGIRF